MCKGSLKLWHTVVTGLCLLFVLAVIYFTEKNLIITIKKIVSEKKNSRKDEKRTNKQKQK